MLPTYSSIVYYPLKYGTFELEHARHNAQCVLPSKKLKNYIYTVL